VQEIIRAMHACRKGKKNKIDNVHSGKIKIINLNGNVDLPGSSFLVNISVSVKLGCGDDSEESQDEPCIEVGGATSVDDLVTTSFKIFNASFH